MHHKYHTDAIILSAKNVGESDKIISFFTREMGVLSAKATGIRKKESKLKYAIQVGSFARIDLVKGKDIWRLTSATHFPLTENIFRDHENKKIFMRMLSLISRLYRGEDESPYFFDDVVKTIQMLSSFPYKDSEKDFFEISFVMMILSHLGYWSDEDKRLPKPYELSITQEMLSNRSIFISTVNKALKDTQL